MILNDETPLTSTSEWINLLAMTITPNRFLLDEPKFVGSMGGELALTCDPRGMMHCCDIVEIRWDLLFDVSNEWENCADLWLAQERAILHTARVPTEGGKCWIPLPELAKMAALVRSYDLWDVELATWLNDAERRDVLRRGWNEIAPVLVMSFHDFNSTPTLDALRHLRDQAREANAAIFKVATRLHSESDMECLLELQSEDGGIPLATMGMGPLGAESRIRCALAGSALNYGYLGSEPTAPGQWEVGKLRDAYQSAKCSGSVG